MKTELIVALDVPKAERALSLVEELQGLPVLFKVGLELFVGEGPALVRELVHRRNRIFLDLKFHDIPNTVLKAARQAAALQVEMFTLHLAGGAAQLRSVREELDLLPELRPRIIGVSVLTSFDDVRWAEVTRAMTGHGVSVESSVSGLVAEAGAWGADGVVCSAHELAEVRRLNPGLFTVVPGIRPSGSGAGDQARVMTPIEARKAGASSIVVGRPILEAPSPRAAAEAILKELSS
jgi:orotidine-5'-phosphate decarboxylase